MEISQTDSKNLKSIVTADVTSPKILPSGREILNFQLKAAQQTQWKSIWNLLKSKNNPAIFFQNSKIILYFIY